ncbi:MAG: M20 family metallopeptidase [Elusimicrobia bacterium]|nr:M20 family metallopeptidase [Elusimicrobiota bacterium]
MKKDFLKKLIIIRRTIHKYPELGNTEYKTAAFIEKILKSFGIKTKRLAKTGVVGILEGRKNSKNSKVLAIRADIDALPIQEKTGKPYSSKRKGIMHACGHDANTTMVLGAAMLLSKQRKNISGKVKFIFQPNEEASGGAKTMIRTGVLKNPAPGIIVGIHVNPWLKTGILGLKTGLMMAAVDKFTIEILGEGGHGAYPNLAKDSVVVASEIVLALQSIVSREIDPLEPKVLTIGSIKGGERFNIIADKVSLVGTVRTLNSRTRKEMRKKIVRRVKGITLAYGVKFRIIYEELGNSLSNSASALKICQRAGEKVLGKRNIVFLDRPSMGGEDFAEYLSKIPGCFIYIGSKTKKSYPWHHEHFDIDEKALEKGSLVLSEIAKTYLSK